MNIWNKIKQALCRESYGKSSLRKEYWMQKSKLNKFLGQTPPKRKKWKKKYKQYKVGEEVELDFLDITSFEWNRITYNAGSDTCEKLEMVRGKATVRVDSLKLNKSWRQLCSGTIISVKADNTLCKYFNEKDIIWLFVIFKS